MPKVFGIHEIELRPDADPDEYESYCRGLPAIHLDGWTIYFLRGDRGRRDGKFAWLFEIESTETRARYSPANDEYSDEMTQWFEQHPEVISAIEPGRFVASRVGTDYLDITD